MKTQFADRFRKTALGMVLAGAALAAQAETGSFTCVAGSFADCSLATSTLSWSWDGLNFTVSNAGDGYVSEVYFDLSGGMAASFVGGTGGDVAFYAGATPSALPNGPVTFTADASFDSDAPGGPNFGIDIGETGTFQITGAGLDSIDIGSLTAGMHVRSLVVSSASVVTLGVPAVPEPETYALMLASLGAMVFVARRRNAR
ncbi:MAG: PEP-CTERM sorting domain-containing protein [Betaproteobacteria bacterium]|nr:MAG: PEP-CTERM sorting domain-containing protein [Betaproteobacteria bacterium]